MKLLSKKWPQIIDNKIIEILENFAASEMDRSKVKITRAQRERGGNILRLTFGNHPTEFYLPSDIMKYFQLSSWSSDDYTKFSHLLSEKCAQDVSDDEIDDMLKRICPNAEVWHAKHFQSIVMRFRTTSEPIITHYEEITISKNSHSVISDIASFLEPKNIPHLLEEDQKDKLCQECYLYADKEFKDKLLKEVCGKNENGTIAVSTPVGIVRFQPDIDEFHKVYIPEIVKGTTANIVFSVDIEKEKEKADKCVLEHINHVLDKNFPIELSKKCSGFSKFLPKEDIAIFLEKEWKSGIFDKAIAKSPANNKKAYFNFRSGKCFVENTYGTAEICSTKSGEPYAVTQVENEYSKKIRSYMGNKDARQRINLFSQLLSKYGFTRTMYKSGSGILCGNTKFDVLHENGYRFSCEYNGNGLEDSFDVWGSEIVSLLNQAQKSCTEKEEKRKADIIERFQNFIGDYLAYDIVTFVEKNNSYITPPAIEEALRGKKVNLNTYITYTPGCGKYNLLEDGVVKEKVHKLCQAGILDTREARNTYHVWFDIIHVNKNTPLYLSQSVESDATVEEIETKETKTSAEIYKLWNARKNPEDLENNLWTIELLHDYGFACRHIDEIENYFMNAPKETTTYMKMLEDTEEDTTIKRILKRIRLDCAKQKKELRNSSKQDVAED